MARSLGPTRAAALVPALVLIAAAGAPRRQEPQSRPAASAATASAAAGNAFELPCTDYRRGLRGRGPHGPGNFGLFIADQASPFAGSWHLGEDVWLPSGTEVKSVARGRVCYSDFSPTWTGPDRKVHWNLGNVIVVEHPLEPPVEGLSAVCSIYVHLGADRRVAVGDAVAKGQVLGRIGKDRSDENGRYDAHLHFGLHRGPYVQIPPAWRRELEAAARKDGLAFGGEKPLRGELELTMSSDTSVLVRAKEGGAVLLLSLLVGSTAPANQPADIMVWCSGYGDRHTVDEWLCPSAWITARSAPRVPVSEPASRPRR